MGPAEWGSGGFRAEAQEWADKRLAELGRTRTGPAGEVSVRPWSTVLRVATADGDVYFKANIPVLAHEPRLVRALTAVDPRRVSPVLADDPRRGWMLSAGGGPTLRSRITSAADLPRFEAALAVYAEFQLETAGRSAKLLAAGAFDYRLGRLVSEYAGIVAAERPQLAGLEPRYRELCERLAGLGLPDTIHHDDFHDANVVAGDAGPRFFDWHEGCVAPPFFSMLIALRVAAWRLELDPHGRELRRLRSAYLEPWRGYGPEQTLNDGLDLALRVGKLTRALSWRRIVQGAGPAASADDRAAAGEWLGELAADL